MSGETTHNQSGPDLVNRLYFLYKVAEDTQYTIRFLDTKAAFCVTLLSGMAAVVLDRPHLTTPAYHLSLTCFLAVTILALLICLRVIFPTIKPSTLSGAPKFYIGHNKAHHWIRHIIRNPTGEVLSETQASYLGGMQSATDDDLLASLSDTVFALALIRQAKSDRLHVAMFCLMACVILFGAVIFV